MNRNQLVEELRWRKFPCLDDGFVCLVDAMGDDAAVVQAARVSYGKDARVDLGNPEFVAKLAELYPNGGGTDYVATDGSRSWSPQQINAASAALKQDKLNNDRHTMRYLMRHRHTTPFEMAELKFLVRVPMDCWRQWIRHRMASVNEYSTRYTNAIDSAQTTDPGEWRLQAANNKQGSSGFLANSEVPSDWTVAKELSEQEAEFQKSARDLYEHRLGVGIAREQARKDLPLSTYTEAYWKIDLHNLLHFLGLRMDSHAQKEIRDYATTIGEQIVKPLFPLVWEAFEDYRLGAMMLTRLDIEVIRNLHQAVPAYVENEIKRRGLPKEAGPTKYIQIYMPPYPVEFFLENHGHVEWARKNSRERDECLAKLQRMGIVQ